MTGHTAAPTTGPSRVVVVAALNAAQTLAWASSYYLPAILANPIAGDLGVARTWVFAAFSLALLIPALLGPFVGRVIERRGGRDVLTLSNLALVAGLLALAASKGPIGLFASRLIVGVGMALGLYDAVFATLTALYDREARGPITGTTLIAGFASTVSWPVSSLLNSMFGWRETCVAWAVLNLILEVPLKRFLIPPFVLSQHRSIRITPIGWRPYREMFLLAFVFAAGWFVTDAMAAHLPRLLMKEGLQPIEAVAIAAIAGPAQVVARIAESIILRRIHLVREDCRRAASNWRWYSTHLGPCWCKPIRSSIRSRQWPSDHRTRNSAVSSVRSERLRCANRTPRRTRARRAGFLSTHLWAFARQNGPVSSFQFIWRLRRCLRRSVLSSQGAKPTSLDIKMTDGGVSLARSGASGAGSRRSFKGHIVRSISLD
jgi:MFS family permease